MYFKETANGELEEGEDDVKSAWPLYLGLHTCYNGSDNEMQQGNLEQIYKNYLSSNCTLQLGCMKLESLVIADQHAAVNTFPGLVHTARQTTGVDLSLSRCANRKEAAYHGRIDDWG